MINNKIVRVNKDVELMELKESKLIFIPAGTEIEANNIINDCVVEFNYNGYNFKELIINEYHGLEIKEPTPAGAGEEQETILNIIENFEAIRRGWQTVEENNNIINENNNTCYCWNYNFSFNNSNSYYGGILESKEILYNYLIETLNNSIYNFNETIEELEYFLYNIELNPLYEL